MRRFISLAAAGALSFLWLSAARADDVVPASGKAKKIVAPAATAPCGEHGTSLTFEATPSDAAKRALKEEKLVMVLHISGYFEDPDFT